MTVRARAFQTPSPGALLLAAAAAPLVAVVLHLISAPAARGYIAADLAALGVVLAAYEACLAWSGVGRALLGRDLGSFLLKAVGATAAGLALAWLAVLLLVPPLRIGFGDAAVVGVSTALLLVAVRSALPLLVPPRRVMEGVLILGRGELAAKLCLDLLRDQQENGLDGLAGDRLADGGGPPGSAGDPLRLDGTRREGGGRSIDPAEILQLVRDQGITRIVVAEADVGRRREIAAALLECRLLGVAVEDAVDLYQRLHGKLWLEAIDPRRLAFSEGFRLTPLYLRAKRAIDVACALGLLIAAAPAMALIALAVKLESPGPVLFRQERVGRLGKTFTLFKFRSMGRDAERDTGPTWARANDSRVTRIGRILRKTHLDEIPQAINVLRGDLSFVGPRPERPCFVEMLRGEIPFYDLRHCVQPGITGWAQVSFPYAGSVEDAYEKHQYDLYYGRNLSLALDLRILFLTVWTMVLGRGR